MTVQHVPLNNIVKSSVPNGLAIRVLQGSPIMNSLKRQVKMLQTKYSFYNPKYFSVKGMLSHHF